MDGTGKIVQQQVTPQTVPSTPKTPGAVTFAAGPGGQLVQQQVGVPQIIAGAGATPQVAQQQIGAVQALTMLPQIQNITLPDGQEAIFIPNNAIPNQATVQPQNAQQIGVQQAVMLPNGQIVPAANVVTPQQAQAAQQPQSQQGQAQAQQQVQSLSGIQGLAQAQGSQIVTIGGVQCVATAVPQQAQNVLQAIQMAPQIQQMQTIHMPVSTANGQTVFQAVQVPVQSLQPGAVQVGGAMNLQQPGVITLGNQTMAAGQLQQQQQQQQIKSANIKTENATTPQEQNQVEVQSQQQQVQQVQIPTISVDSQGNITLNPAPAKGESQQQSQQASAAVLGAAGGLVSMGGGNVGIIQSPQTSTPQTPTVSVASLSQPLVTPASTQSTTPVTPATPSGTQQQVPNILLSNGQIVQGIQSPTVLNATNLQINSNGQIVQTPVINVAGMCHIKY